ncbi:hypothetical protein VNI00_000202 [Paramarasmius palmivorus]|uniref:VHS domain-containing protein n=1 Tax=Paramarasmius palmivorus TaxID=297713 RepID=A0AAW0EFK1_9AGAR
MRREPIEGKGEESQGEVTKIIGVHHYYLTVTGREDWRLVLDVCRGASSDEVLAKEAVCALSRQLMSGRPVAQLHATRVRS